MFTTQVQLSNPVEVERAIRLLTEPGQVFEVRALEATTYASQNYPATYSGYFDAAEPVLQALQTLHSATGIYITLQECDPDLLYRAENKLIKVTRKDVSTTDSDIVRYRWLLIDSDIKRAVKGISSSCEEHELALQHSQMLRERLRERGWPEPSWADSGNGSHLLYPIDLPNTEESKDLLARVLAGLAKEFDTPKITIDQTVFNPGRICKLYGTRVCKGDDTKERPHRLSSLKEWPAEEGHGIVPREMLGAIATPKAEPKPQQPRSSSHRIISIREFCETYNIDVVQEDSYSIDGKHGTRFHLAACAWDPSHTDHAACLYEFDDGTLGASCSHNSCRDKGWKEFRAVFEPTPTNGHWQRRSGAWNPFDVAYDDPQVDMELAWECLKQQQWGDARLFAELFKGHVLYDHSSKDWYYFMGHFWQKDQKRHAPHLVAEDVAGYYLLAAEDLLREARQYPDEEETDVKPEKEHKSKKRELTEQAELFMERARKIWHHSRNANILTDATSIPGMSLAGNEWDANPLVVGCPNGVIDLTTGQLRDGRPEDYIRTITRAEYTGLDTPCPRFERFLRELFQDRTPEEQEQIVAYLQRIIGYGISGFSNQAILPTLWGQEGRNGKETLVRALSFALGDICDTLHKDALILSRGRAAGSAQPYLANLQGKRLLWASETDEGERFNVAQVKMLTGYDDIKARDVYEKAKTFTPTHTLLLLTNHKPHADATEGPFWQRMKLIPFNMSFVETPTREHDRAIDPGLEDALKAEASGILAWCVRGFLMYQREGLNTPQCIKDATEQYRKEEDVLEDFASQRCIEEPTASVQATALYNGYKSWHETQSSARPMSNKLFGKRAAIRWGDPKHTRSGWFYHGVRLRTEHDTPKGETSDGDGCDTCDTRSENFSENKTESEEVNNGRVTSLTSEQCDVTDGVFDTPPTPSKTSKVLEGTSHASHPSHVEAEERIVYLLQDWGAYRTVARDTCRRCGCRIVVRSYGKMQRWNKDIGDYEYQQPGRPACVRCNFPAVPTD